MLDKNIKPGDMYLNRDFDTEKLWCVVGVFDEPVVIMEEVCTPTQHVVIEFPNWIRWILERIFTTHLTPVVSKRLVGGVTGNMWNNFRYTKPIPNTTYTNRKRTTG